MKRREFIVLLGGTFIALAPAAWAQQFERMRRVGFQSLLTAGDPETLSYTAAFEQALARLGWIAGRNVQIDYRWSGGDPTKIRQTAAELLALKPDVILTAGGSQLGPLEELTSTIPIVFVQTTDPVGAGFVDSLARPGELLKLGIDVGQTSVAKYMARRRVGPLRIGWAYPTVLRLMIISYLFGFCTGRAAGFSPLRMRSMYPAASRSCSTKSGP
jgi:ABC transporter substrate binding protein